MRYVIITAISGVLVACSLQADEPQPIELTIHARAIETPVLKYRLLPAESEIKPGNPVPILLRLPWEQIHWMNKVAPTLHEWNDKPLSAPDWQNFGGVFPDMFYREMKRAAYRRDVAWEYPLTEQPVYMILLPDVQGLRLFLGYGLSAKIRYHLIRGEINEAREGILVGLANSRHIAQTPFFVNQLVAVAIQRIMFDRMAELVAQPDSPNLYWALSTLPDSLIELDRAASMEGNAFALMLPAASDLDRKRDAAEWRTMADQLVELLEQLQELPKVDELAADASWLEKFLHRLTGSNKLRGTSFVKFARAELPQMMQITEERVAAMSDEEAAVRWYVHMRINRDQRAGAVLCLPPREAWPRLKELQAESQALHEKTGSKPISFHSPILLYLTTWSLNRKVQSLRIVEAVRHHLATHNGKLPKTLSEIEGVSIPLDPLTDQPFVWNVDGHTATLQAPPLPADIAKPGSTEARAYFLEYRLTVE